ncbi:MAG: glycosyltransferase family 2 protein, partial [Actinobacteria bacterium]|nr:glycosyltransferase family 2 protein [Actinomycetota bacterium]
RVKDFKNYSPLVSSRNFKFIPLKKNLGFAGGVNYAVFNFASTKKELDDNIKYLVLLNPDLSLERGALNNLILPFEVDSGAYDTSHVNLPNFLLKYSGNSKKIGVVGGLILDYEKDIVQHLGGKISINFITSHIDYGKKYKYEEKYKWMNGSKSAPKTGSDTEPGSVPKSLSASISEPWRFDGSEKPGDLKESGDSGGLINKHRDLLNNFPGELIEVDYVTGALFATRYALFKKLGGFDRGYRPAYFEEVDYCMKIKRLGKKVVVNPFSIARHFEGASVGKFTRKFYWYYHKNRIRCALINMSFVDLFARFINEELKWIKVRATRDQRASLLYSYFINLVFLPYSLAMKLRNYLMLSRLRVK